jgi:alkylhydroperoxidase/carboxymuconolactone decarboxylase family protein YurZ
MAKRSAPPKTFVEFSRRFPHIAEAWSLLGDTGGGPIPEKSARLIKLGISIASRSEGATHSATRKALAAGASTDEIFQVVALAASSIGLPQTVAAYTWVRETLGKSR